MMRERKEMEKIKTQRKKTKQSIIPRKKGRNERENMEREGNLK